MITEIVDFKTTVGEESIRNIWDFLGKKFGLNLPFPKVEILLFLNDDWKTIQRMNEKGVAASGGLEGRLNRMQNEHEKHLLKKDHGDDLDADAALMVNDHNDINKQWFEDFGNPDWIILMADNECYLPKNRARAFYQKEFGDEGYYYFHVLHEFLHIYERLTKRQLINGNGEDVKLMYEFLGKNGKYEELQSFNKLIKSNNIKPKSSCKWCYGRGYIGIDAETKEEIMCSCILKQLAKVT